MLLWTKGSNNVAAFELKRVKETYEIENKGLRNDDYYIYLLAIRGQILNEIKAKSKDVKLEYKRLP